MLSIIYCCLIKTVLNKRCNWTKLLMDDKFAQHTSNYCGLRCLSAALKLKANTKCEAVCK